MSDGGRGRFLEARNVSRETQERLDLYAGLLKKWNRTINLVSRSTMADLWGRHYLDSAQLFDLRPAGARTWADLGSGGGFPGLIIAILAAEAAPDLQVTLVESDLRKAAFLTSVLQDVGVQATVHAERIESLDPLGADVVSARALAPLDRLLGLALRHLAPGGTALFPKGANHAVEISQALANWTFSGEKIGSQTDAASVILRIGEITRV